MKRLRRTSPATGTPDGRQNITEPFPQWPLAASDEPPPPRPSWVSAEPFAFVGSWEPPTFRRRSGYAWTDEERYADSVEYSSAAFARIRSLGCNHIVLPFAKGYGRAAVPEDLASLRRSIQRARQAGLRVGTYIQCTSVVPELLACEHPDIETLLARDESGRTHAYHPQQPSRKLLCHSQVGTVAYLEDQIRYAIEELGTDLLHLDGFQATGYPPQGCRCEQCVASYRRWLQRKFRTRAERLRRFGPVDFDRIQPPRFDAGVPLSTIIISPDWQEYFRFQWDRNLALLKHVRRFARRLNPAVALSANLQLSNARNQHVFWGQWAERMLPWLDAVWCEDPFHLRFESGRVISRASIFKLAQESGAIVCCYHWHPDEPRIAASIAFTTAFNGGNAVCLGFTHRFLPHFLLGEESKRRLLHWTKQHWNLFNGARPAGEIALLRHQPSLAWNSARPWAALLAMEQLLTQLRVPWRVVASVDADSLRNVRTLIVPDAECLSDADVADLRLWVESGGRLIATPHTATHNEDRSRRPRNAFAAWTQPREVAPDSAEWYQWLREDYIEVEDATATTADGPPEITAVGRGLLAIVRILPAKPVKDAVNLPIAPEALQPPRNAARLEALLRKVHGMPELQCCGTPGLVLHATRTADAMLVHLVQVNPHARRLNAILTFRDHVARERVTMHSPDPALPRMKISGRTIRLTGLQQYAVIRLDQYIGQPVKRPLPRSRR